jgi:hypothetical protein
LASQDYVKYSGLTSLTGLTDINFNNLQYQQVLWFSGTTWQNHSLIKSDISNFTENDYVHINGTETILGPKTFSSGITLTLGIAVYGFSNNVTLSENTDSLVSTQRAVKTYIDTRFYTTAQTYSQYQLQTSGLSSINWLNLSGNPFLVREYNIQGGFNHILDSINSASTFSVVWKYAIRNQSNKGVKVAHVMVCWDFDGQIEYTEFTTNNTIGDTSDFDGKAFIGISGANVVFSLPVGTTDLWNIKVLRELL